MPITLTTKTVAQLEQLRDDVLNELERRQALEVIPGQIADLKAKFVEGGGDPAELED